MRPRIRFFSEISPQGLSHCCGNPPGHKVTLHARVVRLSFVEGDVTVQRPDVQDWAEAPVNTPLRKASSFPRGKTASRKYNSKTAARSAWGSWPLDSRSWHWLTMASKINHVDLRQGYATFHPLASARGIPESGHSLRHAQRAWRHGIPRGFGPGHGTRRSHRWRGGSTE